MTELEGLDRAQRRAIERESRAQERAAEAQARSERRAAEREQASRERQQARDARQREQDERLKTLRPDPAADGEDAPAKPKRRASGALRKTGDARIERDTRHYSTVVDKDRIRDLAARGTSITSLASVFGISREEVEAALGEG